MRRIGHTGTLDPLASGVLVLMLGGATRLSALLSGHPKSYAGEALLGWATDTYDRTGKPLHEPRDTTEVDARRLQAAAAALTGALQQAPPPFSARKVGGVPLYRRARRGEVAQGRAVAVHVARFQVTPPVDSRFAFTADVSAGTYIRSLIHDLGQALGCGAHLCELRRTHAGPFATTQALSLDALARDPAGALAGPACVPFDAIPLDLPRVLVAASGVADLAHGRPFRGQAEPGAPEDPDGLLQARDGTGRLLALARRGPEPGLFRPQTVYARLAPAPAFTPRLPDGSVDRIKKSKA
jgi:tRNA pseudouridine55 synthase